jgi:hypothetical protein
MSPDTNAAIASGQPVNAHASMKIRPEKRGAAIVVNVHSTAIRLVSACAINCHR